jgi:MFS family permease
MLPMRLFAGRAFAAGNAANFLLQASLFGAVFFMAQFQQVGLGKGPLAAGLRLLPWTSTLLVVAPIAGTLVDRFGSRPLIVVGLALQAAGLAWIAAIVHAGMAYPGLIAPMVITGAGVSMAIPAAQSVVVNSVAERDIGKASGTVTTMRQLGAVFGLAIAVTVFAGAGSYASPTAFSDGFIRALAVSAGIALLGSIAAVAIPPRARTAVAPALAPAR